MKLFLFILFISLSASPGFGDIDFNGSSAGELAKKIYKSEQRVKAFSKFQSLNFRDLISCYKKVGWTCTIHDVSQRDISSQYTYPLDKEQLPKYVRAEVDQYVSSGVISLSGLTTSRWVQKIFSKENHRDIELMEFKDKKKRRNALMDFFSIHCLIRPYRINDIHFCWIENLLYEDILD